MNEDPNVNAFLAQSNLFRARLDALLQSNPYQEPLTAVALGKEPTDPKDPMNLRMFVLRKRTLSTSNTGEKTEKEENNSASNLRNSF